jgi:hypothetical protein
VIKNHNSYPEFVGQTTVLGGLISEYERAA